MEQALQLLTVNAPHIRTQSSLTNGKQIEPRK